MRVRSIAVLGLLVFFISSCQKDLTNDQRGNGQNGTAADSTQLWQFISIDTTKPAGSDTSEKYVFSYDNQDRVSQIDFYTKRDTTTTATYAFHHIANFYYQGNDTMANKATFLLDYTSFVGTDTIYLRCEQGRVTSDSSIKGTPVNQEVRVNSYSQNGGTLVIQSKLSTIYNATSPIVCHTTWVLNMTYVNGNVATEDGSASGDCGASIAWHKDAQYDDKVNPLYETGMRYRLVNVLPFLSFLNAQKNNTISSSVPGSPNSNLVYNYAYRSDGYPLVKWGKDLLDPSFHSKNLYIYHQ